jgi:hypothetical protein
MIFSKDKYYSHSFLNSLTHRFRVSFSKALEYSHKGSSFNVFYPYSSVKIKSDSLDDLNDLCHSRAFSIKGIDVSICIDKCDSCGDCTKFQDVQIVLTSYEESVKKGKVLELCR